jgi:hypothetical protein
MDAAFLNGVGKYLSVPAIGAGVDDADLPPMLQCPMVEESESRESLPPLTFAAPSFYTGYVYLGRVDEQPPVLPLGLKIELLRPDRAATRRNGSAVLWADDVHWSLTGGGAWSYAHRVRPAKAGPVARGRTGTERRARASAPARSRSRSTAPPP